MLYCVPIIYVYSYCNSCVKAFGGTLSSTCNLVFLVDHMSGSEVSNMGERFFGLDIRRLGIKKNSYTGVRFRVVRGVFRERSIGVRVIYNEDKKKMGKSSRTSKAGKI